MATEHHLMLSFDGADIADANRFAAELAEGLRDVDTRIEVRQTRADSHAQDFGATLALLESGEMV